MSEYLRVQGGYAFKSKDFVENGFAGIIKITNITMGVVNIHNTQFVEEDIVGEIDEDKFQIKGELLLVWNKNLTANDTEISLQGIITKIS